MSSDRAASGHSLRLYSLPSASALRESLSISSSQTHTAATGVLECLVVMKLVVAAVELTQTAVTGVLECLTVVKLAVAAVGLIVSLQNHCKGIYICPLLSFPISYPNF